ncbi:EAL domain-containing protein [Burkholderia ubonensis]|uniref:EAL domain-containing protein n=1 Tax=Burkholderia ubonensis TaxID=101571 RepID=UPI00076C95F8|nr:EAL domain-containing protein [Burkholderia ubonensis]KVX74476.1 hypothetical protein WL08_17705 [Burkholderia ubonensis]
MNSSKLAAIAKPAEETVRHLQRQHDIAVAQATLKSIASGGVELVFQPICGVDDLGAVLYYESLVRLRSGDGAHRLLPGRFIPSLERLSLMRHLDSIVVRKVIALLNAHPDYCLGVNVSAQSVFNHGWWAPILSYLEVRSDVAQRLVFEITETARLRGRKAHEFAARLQRLGCRIAIDDVGQGHGIETALMIGAPDIVKVAGPLLKAAYESGTVDAPFRPLMTLARARATNVVAEGVESAELLEFARLSGVGWLQGLYVGEPKCLFGDDSQHGAESAAAIADGLGACGFPKDDDEWLVRSQTS